jgi:hypothetical protein
MFRHAVGERQRPEDLSRSEGTLAFQDYYQASKHWPRESRARRDALQSAQATPRM